jgi:hypothetical protein
MRFNRAERSNDRRLALVHGAFFIGTGVWPIIHMRSFEAATGPKLEHWLVKTMGGLIAVIGGAMIAGALDRRVPRSVCALGATSAATLAASDVIYVAKRRISSVYLADALVEVVLACAWLRLCKQLERATPSSSRARVAT